jgi:hypothetical protein
MRPNSQQFKCKIKLKKKLTKGTKKRTRASPPNPASWIMQIR